MAKKYPGIKYEVDGDDMYIDSLAGHVGDLLRFFVIFSPLNSHKLTKVENDKLTKQLDAAMLWHHCKVEKHKSCDEYILASLLIPFNVAPQTPIDAFLDFASTNDKILRYHFYLTNTTKPTKSTISQYLHEVKDHNHTQTHS